MERNKNRTDLLAAGRKKLQQYRQKKDHKSSSSKARDGVKSSKESGNHEDAENPDIIPQVPSVVADPLESPADSQIVSAAADLHINLEGDSGKIIMQERVSEGTSSTGAPEQDDLEESVDPQDPSSSKQDPVSSGADLYHGSIENLPGVSDVEFLKQERDVQDDDLTVESRDRVKSDDLVATSSGVVETVESDKFPLLLVEATEKLNEDIICSRGTALEKEDGQTVGIEILKDDPQFPVDRFESSSYAEVSVHSGDETLMLEIVQASSDKTDMVTDSCPNTNSPDQDVSRSEKAAVDSSEENTVVKFNDKGFEKEITHGLSCTFEDVIARNYLEERQALQKKAESIKKGETPQNNLSCLSQMTDDVHLIEILKSHLYLSSVTMEFLQSQISELVDKRELSSGIEILQPQDPAKQSENLGQLKTDKQVTHSFNNDLEAQYLSARGEVELLGFKVEGIQNELELSKRNSVNLASELAESRNALGALEAEHARLLQQSHTEKKEFHNLKADYESSLEQIKELSGQIYLLTSEMEESKGESAKISNELVEMQSNSANLAAELVECRNAWGSLQAEHSRLLQQSHAEKEESHKVKADHESSLEQIKELSGQIYLLTSEMEESKGEAAKISNELVEMQNELELSKRNSVSLASELAECRNAWEALQAEHAMLLQQSHTEKEEFHNLKSDYESSLEQIRELDGRIYLLTNKMEESESESAKISNELVEMQNELKLSKKNSVNLASELAECRNVLGALQAEHATLSQQSHTEKEESHRLLAEKDSFLKQVDELNCRMNLLSSEMKKSESESVVISSELAQCRLLILSLEAENSNLMSRVVADSEDICKLNAEKEALAEENLSINAELSHHKDQLSSAFQNIAKLELEFKEAVETVEELTERNICLLNCLHIHELKLKELSEIPWESCSHDHDSRIQRRDYPAVTTRESDSIGVGYNSTDCSSDEHLDNPLPTLVKKFDSLVEAEEVFLKLEQAIVGIFEQSKAGDRVVNSGVSRLIQAFESKTHASSSLSAELMPIESQTLTGCDSLNGLKEEINNLRSIFKRMEKQQENHSNVKIEEINNEEQAETIDALILKLEEFKGIIAGLQTQWDNTAKNVEEASGRFSDRIDTLQKEVIVMKDVISLSFQKLDACTGLCLPANLDVFSHLADSVDVATKILLESADKLEAMRLDLDQSKTSYEELYEKNLTAGRMMQRINAELYEYMATSLDTRVVPDLGYCENAADIEDFETLSRHLNELFKENLHLFSEKLRLESEISQRDEAVEELKGRCSNLCGTLEESKRSLDDLRSLLGRQVQDPLELKSLHLVVREDIAPRISELLEMEEKLNSLTSNFSLQENEIMGLKHNLKNTKDALELTRSDLQQSDQRLASVREKLGIAVSKGKGLVVQRDNLKHSLTARSSELEVCKQELQVKEAKISGLEEKLKSSEVDRIEALESELSYIRNSATQFRDFFLQKDSILQKIEEIVEDLDLPEEFHTNDIVEKVEWLAKSASQGTSLPTDWENKFDSRDSPSKNIRYGDLENKLYKLAEQNEMLEQSLRERNNHVQRLEKVIDEIEMPQQLRTDEPEVRLEWLGRKLQEVERERGVLAEENDMLEQSLRERNNHMQSLEKAINEIDIPQQLRSAEPEVRLEWLRRKLLEVEIEKGVLAEQNDMLEQSLKERNEHMQRLEKAIDEIDMPQQLRSAEPEVRLEWLGRKLLEVEIEKGVLAEQNDMLEQSLKERNEHMQRLEKAIDEIDMPQQLRSAEPEVRLEWLGRKLLEVEIEKGVLTEQNDMLEQSLKERNNYLRGLEKSIDEIDMPQPLRSVEPEVKVEWLGRKLQEIEQEKGVLAEENNILEQSLRERSNHVQRLEKAINEIDVPQQLLSVEPEVRVEWLGGKLLELEQSHRERNSHDVADLVKFQNENEALQTNLAELRAEMSGISERAVQWELEKDNLQREIYDLQEKLLEKSKEYDEKKVSDEQSLEISQKEEQSLKLALDEMNRNLEVIKEERDAIIEKYESLLRQRDELQEEKERAVDKYQTLQSEIELMAGQRDLLKDQLHQEEQKSASTREKLTVAVRKGKALVQQRDALKQTLEETSKNFELGKNALTQQIESLRTENKQLMDHLNSLITDVSVVDPVQKMEHVRKQFHDLKATVKTSADEAVKSRRAAELLFAELNEVQERCDAMQEKLMKSEDALTQCSMKHEEEKKVLMCSIMELKKGFSDIRKGLSGLTDALSHVASKDADLLCTMQSNLCSLMKVVGCANPDDLSLIMPVNLPSICVTNKDEPSADVGFLDDTAQITDYLRRCTDDFACEKENLSKRSSAIDQYKNYINDFLRKTTADCETTIGDKEKQLNSLRRIISLLVEACRRSTLQLENRLAGKPAHREAPEIKENLLNEEIAREVADSLWNAVESFGDVQSAAQEQQRESLNAAMAEKDAQRINVCAELDSAKKLVLDLKSQIEEHELKIKSLTDSLAAKDQEIESLMQALDEEESQMEALQSRADSAEASRSSAMAKLAKTLTRFEELRQLSENLLFEIEALQSQTQERDAEISFLRQELARIASEALAKQEQSKKLQSEVDDELKKKDSLLELERGKAGELSRRVQVLEAQLAVADSSEMSKRGASASRRANSEQVSVAIDVGPDELSLGDDDDDDKAHGFKSLTMSRIVPRAARPVTDRIDGLWVAIERLLMRQPSLRLGLIFYWVLLHAMVAASI
ncbi:nucleoporin [Wolffia australiana]